MTGASLMVGLVVDLDDPKRLGRVKVEYPELGGARSDWARLVSPMAGAGRGMVCRPERGDEVLVGFLGGDLRAPYVLGGLWSAVDKPPRDDGRHADNNWRFLRSRSGHVIRLDDTPGKEKIEVVDRTGGQRVVIDAANKRVRVESDAGSVEVSAPKGALTLSGQSIELRAREGVKVRAGKDVDLGAGAGVKVRAGQGLDLGASSEVKVRAGRDVDLAAGTGFKAMGATGAAVRSAAKVSINAPAVDIN